MDNLTKHDDFKSSTAPWIVIDRDQHSTYQQALIDAKKNNVKVAFSNPCFELWILLHFQPQTANINNGNLLRAVKNDITDYQKNIPNLYSQLSGKQKTAIANAKNLLKNSTQPLGHQNPSTTVHLLVEDLLQP